LGWVPALTKSKLATVQSTAHAPAWDFHRIGPPMGRTPSPWIAIVNLHPHRLPQVGEQIVYSWSETQLESQTQVNASASRNCPFGRDHPWKGHLPDLEIAE
jgi:hypothetical protein